MQRQQSPTRSILSSPPLIPYNSCYSPQTVGIRMRSPKSSPPRNVSPRLSHPSPPRNVSPLRLDDAKIADKSKAKHATIERTVYFDEMNADRTNGRIVCIVYNYDRVNKILKYGASVYRIKQSGTESKQSGTESKQSSTESKQSGVESKQSGTESKQSDTENKQSGSDKSKQSDTENKQTETNKSKQSDTESKQSFSKKSHRRTAQGRLLKKPVVLWNVSDDLDIKEFNRRVRNYLFVHGVKTNAHGVKTNAHGVKTK